jgi:hypothetical protein
MKRILALNLVLIMLMSLTACGGDIQSDTVNGVSDNQQQEQTSGNTTDENGRSKATEFTYELDAEQERTVENLIFDEDVTISGDFGIIVFDNCEFHGDIINTAEQFTRVILTNGTTVDGACVFRNTTKEATMDTPIPKFIGSETLNIICEDCIGAGVVENAEANIIFNGESYSIGDAEYFWEAETESVVPYEGQQASVLFVGQWWEDGEKFMFIECEE